MNVSLFLTQSSNRGDVNIMIHGIACLTHTGDIFTVMKERNEQAK